MLHLYGVPGIKLMAVALWGVELITAAKAVGVQDKL